MLYRRAVRIDSPLRVWSLRGLPMKGEDGVAVSFRNYVAEPRFGEDYDSVRAFCLKVDDINYPFGRWDWMISHSYLNAEGLPRIGLWLDGEEVVAVATYDTRLDGKCFFLTMPGYEFLKRDMAEYARANLAPDGNAQMLVKDGDAAFAQTLSQMGYIATQSKDCDAVFDIDVDRIQYSLPDGFSITSMRDTYDLYQYGRVLWKGFNHELNGEGPYLPSPEKMAKFKAEFERPNVNLDLKIAVVAPDGNFVSYCGMWQDSASPNALVEPVATDPAYRKMGLGRAAVLEAIRRCGLLGANKAYVGSSQQFYYSIGFRPCITSTWWAPKNSR